MADFHGGRATFERALAYTDSEGNVSEDIAPDLEPGSFLYALAESGSGSQTVECSAPGGEGAPTVYWASGPSFVDPPEELRTNTAYVRPVNDLNLTMTLGAGAGEASAVGPVAGGDVTFAIKTGYVNPGASSIHWHDSWGDEVTKSPSAGDDIPDEVAELLPLPVGLLTGPIEFEIPSSDQGTSFGSGAVIVFEMIITCTNFADFSVGFGAGDTWTYIWGEGDDVDTTGGGIPDRWAMYPDGTQWSYDDQVFYGTDPSDPNDIPSNDSEDCAGLTIQEAKDQNEDYQRGQPDTCPDDGGIPWLLLLLALLLVVLLVGGAFGAVTTVNKKVRMTVSHDGFQDIKQGESAQYELLLTAKGKEDEEVPVELSLKGVPEDWSASVDPAHMTLIAGEEPEPVTASLTVTPPPEEEYEAEAVVTVTATPTDEDGKTSPIKPGTSVKTKTIVNIDVEPPEGEKRKKIRKPKPKQEPGVATEEETGEAEEGADEEEKKGRFSKMKGGLGLLRRKGKEEESGEEAEAGEQEPGEGATEAGAAGAAGTAGGKPDLAVGKLAHDPADFSAGDEVTTTVPVKNKGDQAVEGLMLRLYVNDDRVDEKEVNLEPGAASEVTFTWTAQPDENRVRVRGGLKEA